MISAIRICIFEDNKDFRESLELLIETHIEFVLCGSYDNANKIEQKIKSSAPELVLMDINMPGINGIDAVKIIKANNPQIQILMQTVFDEQDKIFASLCAGASGYILKNTAPDRIVQAIREVAFGGTFFTPSIAAKVLGLFQQQNPQPEFIQLSPREKEILQSMVNGNSYKMIAANLKISYETAHTHIKNVYGKLHVNSASEAVAKAIKQKLV